jgi:predicted aminopeptidase
LAHLYFHELTHKTAWVKGSVELNENLAEFIGEELTERFFESQDRKADLIVWAQRRRDRELFKEWLGELKSDLERYYVDTPKDNLEAFVLNKKLLIDRHLAVRPKFEAGDLIGTRTWNTPRVLGASLYSPETAVFKRAFECSGLKLLGDFAREVKKRLEKADSVDSGLGTFCLSK